MKRHGFDFKAGAEALESLFLGLMATTMVLAIILLVVALITIASSE